MQNAQIFRVQSLSRVAGNSLASWITAKITNALVMLALMNSANEKQRNHYRTTGGSRVVEGRPRTILERAIGAGLFDRIRSATKEALVEIEDVLERIDKDSKLPENSREFKVDTSRIAAAIEVCRTNIK